MNTIHEQYFLDRSNYRRPISPDSVPVDDVEAILNKLPHLRCENKPNGGIIRSSAEKMIFGSGLKGKELKAVQAKAQREHQEAMKNLDKQGEIDRQAIKKQTAIWAAENRAAERLVAKQKAEAKVKTQRKVKAERKIKVKAVKQVKVKAVKKIVPVNLVKRAKTAAYIRRAAMIKQLRAGQPIALVTGKSTQQVSIYQMQRIDIKEIAKKTGLNIVRIKNIKTNSDFFVVDRFTRHEMAAVSGALDADDRADLIKAVCSNELIQLANITSSVKIGAASMTRLARQYGFNIYSVFNGRKITGWILLEA